MTPAGVRELVSRGHRVLVEKGAGEGSSLPDEDYRRAGADLVTEVDALWAESDLVCKVKEPLPEEYHRLREDLVLLTYLHLAASAPCTAALVSSRYCDRLQRRCSSPTARCRCSHR